MNIFIFSVTKDIYNLFFCKKNHYTKMFWKICIMSYEKFTRKIEKLPAKSLTLTRQVLDEILK